LHKLHNKISFQGATTLNLLDPPENCAADSYKWGHLAMTYTSIAILVILGDDLSRLDRKGIIEGKSNDLFVLGRSSNKVFKVLLLFNDWMEVSVLLFKETSMI
jgi:hypothetical protein